MVYMQAENITKSYGDLELFRDISLSLHREEKVAIVAKNGAGKSSLLNIIAGRDSADSGNVILRNGITMGFLDQDPRLDENKTIFEEVYASSSGIMHLLREYETAMHSGDKDTITDLLHRMDAQDAWGHETRVKQILQTLKVGDIHQKTGALSGGQKKRVALARLLITEPDIFILDEPTNHLDLEMIEWLEDYFSRPGVTLLMVTHDRYFLDRICTGIIELDDKVLYSYKGNYSYFLEKREERVQNFNTEVDKARNLLRKELDWIRRMPKARGTKAKSRVDAFYDLQEKASRKKYDEKTEINVSASRLGNKILEIAYLNKAFGDKVIVRDFTYILRKYEKIGIVGRNGSGKTTLLNLITGKLKADSGTFEYGETVVTGYYTQDGLQYKEGQKVIDVVKEIAEVITISGGKKMSVSQFLQYFLFPPSMQYTLVSKLSGGEKRRLHLVTVLMRSPNFLILDEPTNDLDILTLNVLEEYLASFPGCILMVSHDRFFLDKLSDHLFVFEGEGRIKDYPGNYSEYKEWRIRQDRLLRKTTVYSSDTRTLRNNAVTGKLTFKEKIELEQLEKELENLYTEKMSVELSLSGSEQDSDIIRKLSERFSGILSEIEEKEMRWLELNEKISDSKT